MTDSKQPIPEEEELFSKALDIDDEAERNEYLKEVCGDDVSMRARLDTLLSAHNESVHDDFLEPKAISVHQPERKLPFQFGDYEVTQKIARGAMGVVYRARQTSLNREVALKFLRGSVFATGDEVSRFRAEAEVCARLNHPNILPIYEVGEIDDQHYFSMKLIEGGNLESKRQQLQGNPRRSVAIVAQVARALAAAHEHGVVHRDLKPENVLIDEEGEPHVVDFGLAKQQGDSSQARTLSGDVIGTPSYMAPEQAEDGAHVTALADVYSLGAVLYFLLTGSAPFAGGTVMATLQLLKNSEPKRPREIDPNIDPDLDYIAMKCLEKDPARRYSSATTLAEDLERWLRGDAISARPSPGSKRHLRWFVGGLAAGFATASGLAFLLFLTFGKKNERLSSSADQLSTPPPNPSVFVRVEGQLQVLERDPDRGVFYCKSIGPAAAGSVSLNSIAFNDQVGRIYTINDERDLLRINPYTGEITKVATQIAVTSNGAAYNPQDGLLYFRADKHNVANGWIGVDPRNGNIMRQFKPKPSIYVNDFAFDPVTKRFWGARNRDVYSMDVEGEVTKYQNAIRGFYGEENINWGGVISDAVGNVGLIHKESGSVLSIDTATGRTEFLAKIEGLPAGGIIDAASSTAAECDLFLGWPESARESDNVFLTGDQNDNRLVAREDSDHVIEGHEGDDVLIGGDRDDRLIGGPGADTMDGGAGVNVLNYRSSRSGVRIDLQSGLGQGGDAEGDQFENFSQVEGSDFDDTLQGDAQSNVLNGYDGRDQLFGGEGSDHLVGGDGPDELDGGEGEDSAKYSESTGGVRIDLKAGTGLNAAAEGDTLTNIENLIGSAFDDLLVGDDQDNVLDGGAGADIIRGGEGGDRISGGPGADQLDGGEDRDIISYWNSSAGIYIHLGTGVAYGGDAEGDTFQNFSYVHGSEFDDTIYGDKLRNYLTGFAGDDSIYGGEGLDMLLGGPGADRLDGGPEFDSANYEQSDEGVQVDLEAGVGKGGEAEGDVLIEIEQLMGSMFDDRLTGDARSNQLEGNDGDDVLKGAGGDDVLLGGAGKDVAMFSGDRVDYRITEVANGRISIEDARPSSPDGTDEIDTEIEEIHFADGAVKLQQLR